MDREDHSASVFSRPLRTAQIHGQGVAGAARVVASAPLALLAGGVVGAARVVAPAPLALSDADARVDGASPNHLKMIENSETTAIRSRSI
jgi:hypothetical protein